jgi:branched-chain amino acid transport system ATP-binding protein
MISEKAILRTENVGVSFGALRAVQDVNLEVREGEVLGLLGPNGAGKTTLLNMIAGATSPTSGKVVFKDADITKTPVAQRARLGIARTFQITQPFVALTVLENVMVGGMISREGPKELRERAAELIEYVGLSAKKDALADSLSTGQRKRLELARALSINPSLLLMDEVTGGVDQPSIPSLIKLVSTLPSKGITVVIIEHNMQIITELCDRVLFMNNGSPIDLGPPAQVLRNPTVVNLYLGGDDLC